ncbi:MAG: hypothetical protein JNK82_25810 [Myxococcaceae bacterium]|nr:hypothetical protein [Myxococcaceae bacterium]
MKRLVLAALLTTTACGKTGEPIPSATGGGSGTAGGSTTSTAGGGSSEAGGSATAGGGSTAGGQQLPMGATRTSPVTATLSALGNPGGFQPLNLNRSVRVTATAGQKSVLSLGAPASAEAAWLGVRAKSAASLSSGDRRFSVTADATAWVLVPLVRGRLELTPDVDVELSVRGGGWFDQSGAGLKLGAETPLELDLAQGATPLTLPAAAGNPIDDTWGTWLDLTASGATLDTRVELRGCNNEDALEVLSVPANTTRRATLLAPRGPLCLWASEPVKLKVQVKGRYQRFEKTSARRVTPLTLLDTANGVGWSGVPLAGQPLAVDLSNVSGLTGSRALVLRVDGALVLHDAAQPLTVVAPDARHVTVTLIATVEAGDAVPSTCAAWPAEGACAATDLLGRLNCVPGVRAVRRPPPAQEPNAEQYLLQVTQLADHSRPDGETFEQQVLLTFVSEGAPVVMHHTGYSLFSYRSDLGRHLNANELEIEHRFFDPSTPPSRDFTKLDIVQSAFDSHHIVELLRPVLRGRWLGTGHSKGGMTTTYHRRFFPCDTDASVPYVTPLSYSLSDPRYGPWLQNLGGAQWAACRQVFRDIDRGIIANRATFATQLRGTYSKIGSAENALWAMTGMMSWGLFQYGMLDDPQQGCPAYEATAADPTSFAQLIAYYAQSGESYSDQGLAQGPMSRHFGYMYQMTNELGGQGASRAHLTDLGTVPTWPEPSTLMLGPVAVPQFEARAMRDIQDWVSTHGSRMLFIYGELDPWTGGQLELGNAVDSLKLYAPASSHGAGIEDLAQADRLAAEMTLQRWLGTSSPMMLQAGAVRRHPMLDRQPQFKDVMQELGL